jgi:hypothetical protein
MVTSERYCPECGGAWIEDQTCADYFHLMGIWEMEYLLLDVHHLMVLSYHLQHPSLYSVDGLAFSKTLLVDFVEKGMTPQEVRKRIRDQVDSGKRKFVITARPDSIGAYANPVTWSMTAVDVIARGMDNYYTSVEAWAESILNSLRESGNL